VKAKILLIDDDVVFLKSTGAVLSLEGYSVETLDKPVAALEKLKEKSYDLVLVDVRMPGMDGITFLNEARKIDPDLVVVMMTGHGSVMEAVKAMKQGAFDYIEKNWDAETRELQVRIEKALAKRKNDLENRQLKEEFLASSKIENIIGEHSSVKKLFELIERVAQTDVTVLIHGETGTGKELVARAIHAASPRRTKPMVVVNCPAFSETLLESELFGHEKGSFTGAYRQKLGRFEMADGGTLFMDEVGDIPLATQAKLLRAIQEKQFERVGGTDTISSDVRIIAATNRNLEAMAADGKFREDLYFRLKVFVIEMPPLRDRKSDIPILAEHFLNRYNRKFAKTVKSVSGELLQKMTDYPWPGNIRELEHAIQIGVLMEDSDTLTQLEFSKNLTSSPQRASAVSIPSTDGNYDDFVLASSRQYILDLLKTNDGNVNKAADKSGMNLKTFYRKMKECGIEKDDYKGFKK